MSRNSTKTHASLPRELRAQLQAAIAGCYNYFERKPGSPEKGIHQAVVTAIEEAKQKAPKKKSQEESRGDKFHFEPKIAKKAFEKYAKGAGLQIKKMLPSTGISFMCSFYGAFRADGCPLDADGDMLLYEWGTYDSKFQLSITRQFMKESGEDEDMSQLRLIFRFAPTTESAALGSGNKWFKSPRDVQAFKDFIRFTAPYRAFAERPADEVEFYYQDGL